ncbi:MAG TPA: TatD family nuclease-associated radical SAM protein [Capillibacterium sp.]
MGQVYAYPIGDRLYLNITNRCPNRCVFCIRNNEKGVGYNLWLDREPSAEEVLTAAGNAGDYREVVFCGYGEPLLRWEVVAEVARALKTRYNVPIRVNTNGLAEALLKQSILPKLQGLVDTISISLNAADAATYDRLCRSSLGPEAYPALLRFIRESKKFIPRVVVSVVQIPGFDPEPARKIAEELGVEFRVRSYLTE